MSTHFTRTAVSTVLTIGALVAGFATPMAAQAATDPGSPPGANDWECRPTPEHPEPVVLVHATFTNMHDNWLQLSPRIKAQGYCVFAFNYGVTNPSLPGVGGLASVASSGKTMSAFVDRVLATTGARKVDLVGHSQGGMLLKYCVSALGQGSKVDRAVALAPSIHGTTLSGLTKLAAVPFLGPALTSALATSAPGAYDQDVSSPFMTALNRLPDTAGGAELTVISTRYDAVVTPYLSQRPSGAGTRWIVLQSQCAVDFVDHVGMAFDSIAQRDVLNALDPDGARPISCRFIAPLVGG